MVEYNSDFCNKLSNICYNHFDNLPKTGKPKENEWTVLSCIVKEDTISSTCEVVSLGTGSKCIGIDKMSNNGDILNDSHAEVMCRRSFLRYIYEELMLTIQKLGTLFTYDDTRKKFILQKNICFHFFTSHVPCGDASIFLKGTSDDFGEIIETCGNFNKRTCDDDEIKEVKRMKMDDVDIYRTGAKCLPNSSKKDSYGEGKNYHVTGIVRTKPGRGSPTLSVSCSDKMSKWCHVGIQGALLSILLKEPIYMDSIIIGGGVPFCKNTCQRAFYDRLSQFHLNLPYLQKQIFIAQADETFSYSKTEGRQPTPSSISWYKFMKNKCEVSVDGRKQGVTKKNINKKIGRLSICKRELMECFLKFTKEIQLDINRDLTYGALKELSTLYQEMWNNMKVDGFKIWTVKDNSLLNFRT